MAGVGIVAFTVVEVRNAKPRNRAYKMADEKGLYFFVTPTGTKSWRMKYRYGGKEKALTFGQFPEVALTEARDRRDAARATLRLSKDPAVEAERARRAAIAAVGAAFETSARAWHEDERPLWSARYAGVVMNALTRDIFPDLGKLPIADIDGPLILRVLRKIERRGSIETAKRGLGYLGCRSRCWSAAGHGGIATTLRSGSRDAPRGRGHAGAA